MNHIIVAMMISVLIASFTQAQPYGLEREQARKRSNHSLLAVENSYNEVRSLLSDAELTGDDEHDKSTVVALEQYYIKWKELRRAQCGFDSYINIYPSDSRLFEQSINHCFYEMNTKQLEYLRNVKFSLSLKSM